MYRCGTVLYICMSVSSYYIYNMYNVFNVTYDAIIHMFSTVFHIKQHKFTQAALYYIYIHGL